MDTKKLWRYTNAGRTGGVVFAETQQEAFEKLRKKFPDGLDETTLVWSWEDDDFFDPAHPDVINAYDC